MRLNWSNLGRGLEAVANAKIARDVAKAGNKAPGVTEGAYGSGLEDNIEQVRGLRSQAAQEASYNTGGSEDAIAAAEQQYNPALEELQRRAALTQADYSVGGSPNYSSSERAMAEQGLMRSQREAEAYRNFGMVDKANEVEGLALNRKLQLTQEERALAQEARAQAGETRAGERFTTEQAQRELGLVSQQREAAQVAAIEKFDQTVATLPPEQRTEENMRKVAAELGLDRDSQLKVYARNLQIGQTEIAAMDQYVEKVLRKNPTLNGVLDAYKADSRLDPNTHVVKSVDEKTGAVTLTQVKTLEGGKDGEPVMTLGTFPNEAVALSQLRAQAKDPSALANWTMAERDRKNEDKKLENDVARLKVAQDQQKTNNARLVEDMAAADRQKFRDLEKDARARKMDEAQLANVKAETLLRDQKATGRLTSDDVLKATMRLLAADPELDTKVAVKRVQAVAAQINKGEADTQLKAQVPGLQQLDEAKIAP
jgi:hypothetical protein